MRLEIPRSSLFRPVVNTFVANFNTPTAGKYNFAVAGNTNVDVMQINAASIYLMDILNFSATVPETAYIENLQVTPAVRFELAQAKSVLWGQAIPLVKYLPENSVAAFFETKQKQDKLQATFTGILNQNGSLTPYGSVTAVLALNVYEITDAHFIAEFHGIRKSGEKVTEIVIPPGMERRI